MVFSTAAVVWGLAVGRSFQSFTKKSCPCGVCFADVVPLHPLLCQRRLLDLEDWDGLQLLSGARVLWVAGSPWSALGQGGMLEEGSQCSSSDRPLVHVFKETRIVQASSNQPSLLLKASVGSSILDCLLNYTVADWRGGMGPQPL